MVKRRYKKRSVKNRGTRKNKKGGMTLAVMTPEWFATRETPSSLISGYINRGPSLDCQICTLTAVGIPKWFLLPFMNIMVIDDWINKLSGLKEILQNEKATASQKDEAASLLRQIETLKQTSGHDFTKIDIVDIEYALKHRLSEIGAYTILKIWDKELRKFISEKGISIEIGTTPPGELVLKELSTPLDYGELEWGVMRIGGLETEEGKEVNYLMDWLSNSPTWKQYREDTHSDIVDLTNRTSYMADIYEELEQPEWSIAQTDMNNLKESIKEWADTWLPIGSITAVSIFSQSKSHALIAGKSYSGKLYLFDTQISKKDSNVLHIRAKGVEDIVFYMLRYLNLERRDDTLGLRVPKKGIILPHAKRTAVAGGSKSQAGQEDIKSEFEKWLKNKLVVSTEKLEKDLSRHKPIPINPPQSLRLPTFEETRSQTKSRGGRRKTKKRWKK